MVLSEDLPQEQQQQAPRAGTALPLQVYLRLFGRGMEEKNKKKTHQNLPNLRRRFT